jgi:hypothetical protein
MVKKTTPRKTGRIKPAPLLMTGPTPALAQIIVEHPRIVVILKKIWRYLILWFRS